MKIGILCYPTYGGSGVVATELGHALARNGHQVHFISYAPPFRMLDRLPNVFYHEVSTMNYPVFKEPPYTLAAAAKVVELADLVKLDLLHVHYAVPHAIVAYLASKMTRKRLPYVTTLHGTDITLIGTDPAFKPMICFGIAESDATTSVSHYLAKETHQELGCTGDIEVIPNFINAEEFSPSAGCQCKSMFVDPDDRVLMHISNFRPVKNVGDAVRAFAKIRKKVKSKLLMVGDGPDALPSRQIANGLGVGDDVKFLGRSEDVPGMLAMADVFLLPSAYESFGLAALEAMACGVPVISTNAGGLSEVVEEGKSGYLVNVGDVDAMADRAIALLENDDLHKKMSASARALAIDRFGEDRIVPQYEALYEKVLSASRRKKTNVVAKQQTN